MLGAGPGGSCSMLHSLIEYLYRQIARCQEAGPRILGLGLGPEKPAGNRRPQLLAGPLRGTARFALTTRSRYGMGRKSARRIRRSVFYKHAQYDYNSSHKYSASKKL